MPHSQDGAPVEELPDMPILDSIGGECLSHRCSVLLPCEKVACPHCAYKYDEAVDAHGFVVEGKDPTNPANYNTISGYPQFPMLPSPIWKWRSSTQGDDKCRK